MVRKSRIFAALLCLVLVTLLFLDFTGTAQHWFGWLARVQFLPAVLALNLVVVAALLLLTLLFGRIYCSVLCPLGVFQDVISWIAARKRPDRFRPSPALTPLRYGVLAVFVALVLLGLGPLFALLAPYSAYGRMVSSLLGPLYGMGNNLLARFAERSGSFAFYGVEAGFCGVGVLAVAGATFLLLVVLAWRNGRTYCNTICPVGTVLGICARFSLFRLRIDADTCAGCGVCARGCKASCIDPATRKIDHSRCVMCLDCLGHCPKGSLTYTMRRTPDEPTPVSSEGSPSRRRFLTLSTLLAAGGVLWAQEHKVDGGLAPIVPKKAPRRGTRIKPAGARSLRDFSRHCTACQLCVTACPNHVLRPSDAPGSLVQPEMSFERGYCRPECTRCSEVCPTGAIRRITRAEKSAIQIGHAVLNPAMCIVNRDGAKCNNCARHCPTGAIFMAPRDPDNLASPKIPVIDAERCIGCGACEFLCPSRPLSAIHVEGHERHRTV